MCRIPKIVLVAPPDAQSDLRRRLSSLEYDIVAAVASTDDVAGITCDAAILWEPTDAAIEALRGAGVKTVALGGSIEADLQIAPEDAASFKTRVWELFRPS